MLGEALRYAGLGWRVFPVWQPVAVGVCSCRKGARCGRDCGKHPRTPHGKNEATVDETQIREWWARWPAANIAVALPSHQFFVVDLDVRDGKRGDETWARTCAEHAPMPPTVYARSGSGGWHGLYRRPAASDIVELSAKLAPGVDLPTSYFLVAPSLHSCGQRYEWIRAPWDHEVVEAPPWLVEMARARGAHSPGSCALVPDEGARARASSGADATSSGDDWRTALGMIRRGATDAEVADALREGASFRKRHPSRAENYVALTIRKARGVVESTPAPDPWANAIRVRILGAVLEPMSARPWANQGSLTRVRLQVATSDGKALPRQYVVVPVHGHEGARAVYDAVLGDFAPEVWDTPEAWTLAERLVGRELEVVVAAGAKRASRMRRVP